MVSITLTSATDLNPIIVALQSQNIDAEIAENDKRAIFVAGADFGPAWDVIHSLGLETEEDDEIREARGLTADEIAANAAEDAETR